MPKFQVGLPVWGYVHLEVDAATEKDAWDNIFIHQQWDPEGTSWEAKIDWDQGWEMLQEGNVWGQCMDDETSMDCTVLSDELKGVLDDCL